MKNKLRKWRRFRDFTQSQLAEKAGVSRQTIYSIEQGRYVPSTLLSLKLAGLLELQVEELFELEEGDWDHSKGAPN